MDGMGDTFDVVPIGAWHGKGKRTGKDIILTFRIQKALYMPLYQLSLNGIVSQEF